MSKTKKERNKRAHRSLFRSIKFKNIAIKIQCCDNQILYY